MEGIDVELQDLGIKRKPLTEQGLRVVLFFQIDNIEPYIEGDIEYSIINSGGNEYICHLSYAKLKDILIEAFNKENYKAV